MYYLFRWVVFNGLTGEKFKDVDSINDRADDEFIKDIKDLPSRD